MDSSKVIFKLDDSPYLTWGLLPGGLSPLGHRPRRVWIGFPISIVHPSRKDMMRFTINLCQIGA
jgi:hypothetical protein